MRSLIDETRMDFGSMAPAYLTFSFAFDSVAVAPRRGLETKIGGQRGTSGATTFPVSTLQGIVDTTVVNIIPRDPDQPLYRCRMGSG